MLREYFALRCLRGCGVVPTVLGVSLQRRELLLSHIRGQRLLEWVLERYGPPGLALEQFRSFHGLEGNSVVADAFSRFRKAVDPDSGRLRHAIRSSYLLIHGRHILHSDPSPRNLIYDGNTIHVIDFDHARPSLSPAPLDFRSLSKWYGVSHDA
jgi:tRNA A-37 threonylcarbamoyl transferase component Bud32